MRGCCVLFTWHEGVDCLCTDRFGVCSAVFSLRRNRYIPCLSVGRCMRTVPGLFLYLLQSIAQTKFPPQRRLQFQLTLAPLVISILQARFQSRVPWLLLQVLSMNHARRDLCSSIPLPVSLAEVFTETTSHLCSSRMSGRQAFLAPHLFFSPGRPHAWLLCPLPSSSPFPSLHYFFLSLPYSLHFL